MSAVYIPEPLTAPELFYPGRAPTVPVKLNLRHPLAKNLEAALFADPCGAAMMIDYARRITIPVDEVSGGAVIFDGGRSYPIGLQELNGKPAMSITTRAYTTDTNSNNNIVSSHDATTSQDQYVSIRFDVVAIWGGVPNSIKVAMTSGTQDATESVADVYEIGVPVSITSRWEKGDPNLGVFANGLSVFGEVRSVIPGTSSVAFSSSQMHLGVGPQTSLKGGIFFVLVHSRKLTDGEIQSLHSNPYQILEAA